MTEKTENTPAVQVQAPTPTTVDISTQAMSLEAVGRQFDMIKEAMQARMQDGVDYGVIPGCGDKPALLKPGKELLCVLFRLRCDTVLDEKYTDDGHLIVRASSKLVHIPTGMIVSSGEAAASTLEGKYRWRNGERKCPQCDATAIIKGKEDFGGGWLCWNKKGGCGAKFLIDDKAITGQAVGKVEHDSPADYYNTVIKMAKKRAENDAVLSGTAASKFFTTDIDESPPDEAVAATNGAAQQQQAATSQAQAAPPQQQQASDVQWVETDIPVPHKYWAAKKAENWAECKQIIGELVGKDRVRTVKTSSGAWVFAYEGIGQQAAEQPQQAPQQQGFDAVPVTAEPAPQLYFLRTAESQHKGKQLIHIPQYWLEKAISDPKRRAVLCESDVVNIEAYWKMIAQGFTGHIGEAPEQL